MTRNVDTFCPETCTFAPNLEQHNHWSVEKPPSFAVDGESFVVIPGTMDVSNNEPPCSDVLPYLAHIRTFGLKPTGSGNVSEHSTSDLLRIMSAECTKTVCDNLHLERILSLSPVVLLKIEGKCAGFRAKSVHISGHLPAGLDGGK
jgi:hypothetical protein